MTITLKGIPNKFKKRIQMLADRKGRSLNQQATSLLGEPSERSKPDSLRPTSASARAEDDFRDVFRSERIGTSAISGQSVARGINQRRSKSQQTRQDSTPKSNPATSCDEATSHGRKERGGPSRL
jgi:hypothetical protein